MRRPVGCPRRCSWWVALAALTLLVVSGCSDAPISNPSGDDDTLSTRTPVPTSASPQAPGWQLYRDKPYAFAIQYPPGWTAQPEPQPGASFEVVSFFPAGSARSGAAPTQNLITITTGANQPGGVNGSAPPGFVPDGSVTVAGKPRTLLSGPESAGGQALLVTLTLGKQVFVFYSTADDASAALFQQMFTQMLSTFEAQSA